METVSLPSFMPTKEDYQEALIGSYLSEWPIMLASLPAIVIIIAGGLSVVLSRTSFASSPIRIVLLTFLATFVFLPFFYYLRIYFTSKIAAQNDKEEGEISITLTEEEFILKSNTKEIKIKWEMLDTYRDQKKQILLFAKGKNQQIQFIPKRILSTPELETAFWKVLAEKNFTRKTKMNSGNRRALLIFIMIDLIMITCLAGSYFRNY